MTRLESAIRRLSAQRDLLDWAARDVGSRDGIVVEFGLGNGRTYDHLRKRLPGRRIMVFERNVAAHPDCIPPSDCLVLGDISETLPAFVSSGHAGTAVLIHADIGTGDTETSDALAIALSPAVEAFLAPGGAARGRSSLSAAGLQGHLERDGCAAGPLFRISPQVRIRRAAVEESLRETRR